MRKGTVLRTHEITVQKVWGVRCPSSVPEKVSQHRRVTALMRPQNSDYAADIMRKSDCNASRSAFDSTLDDTRQREELENFRNKL